MSPQLLLKVDVCWAAIVGLCIMYPSQVVNYHARYQRMALEAGGPSCRARGMTMEAIFFPFLRKTSQRTTELLQVAESTWQRDRPSRSVGTH
ncbi:hypothetical protein BCY86_00845 [Pajaroellobacter abortibovis]|uniref:Uncharacterized protein n=1 Tax=Pajaroellobacter abortibovis TaxID=1882918 RepID=A0A1L6MV68_9BACT|nr:hypothetical protein BCY86_00845 [Pajaroellobacter abortibovis]